MPLEKMFIVRESRAEIRLVNVSRTASVEVMATLWRMRSPSVRRIFGPFTSMREQFADHPVLIRVLVAPLARIELRVNEQSMLQVVDAE